MGAPISPLSATRLDQYLDGAVTKMFRHDVRLRDLDLRVEFRAVSRT